MILHATLVAYRGGGEWRGLLLRGPSGAGKSGLALRLMRQGWRLVADDRVMVWRSGGRLFGRAPDSLRGLIEGRGVGVFPVPAVPFAEIFKVVDAAEANASPDRIPDPSWAEIGGVSLPRLVLNLGAPTAPAAVALWCGAGGV